MMLLVAVLALIVLPALLAVRAAKRRRGLSRISIAISSAWAAPAALVLGMGLPMLLGGLGTLTEAGWLTLALGAIVGLMVVWVGALAVCWLTLRVLGLPRPLPGLADVFE